MTRRDVQAVIVVDVQADFTEYRNGALAVPDTGQDYVENTVEATRNFKNSGLPIFATRDYHPVDHVSFFTSHPGQKALDVIRIGDREQVLWPPHCVQETPGAEILIPPDLITAVISTGDRSEFESYSGFRDDGGRRRRRHRSSRQRCAGSHSGRLLLCCRPFFSLLAAFRG